MLKGIIYEKSITTKKNKTQKGNMEQLKLTKAKTDLQTQNIAKNLKFAKAK